jgi:hypothetical protein
MKAFYQISCNRSKADKYGDLPDPVAGKNQLLIGVKVVSVNPFDYKIKKGDLKLIAGSKFAGFSALTLLALLKKFLRVLSVLKLPPDAFAIAEKGKPCDKIIISI